MLKSLSSGVSGLQAHQIAMDVESNNIANVSTVGFKYSRANFSNLLAQVNQIATAPQGNLGGKNSTQIGLGTTISSMTRIDSQGSVQNTDKNTDCAIQGDGYFIVSGDAGKTLQFSRNGDFSFDAAGNFVDNNGFVVEGWLRDTTTGKVDATAPITQIQIPSGLTTPAQASTQIVLKANLASGAAVNTFSAISSLDQFTGAADLNRDGKLDVADSLSTPQVAYDNLPYNNGDANALTNPDHNSENTSNLILKDSAGNIIERGQNMGVMVDGSGNSLLLQQNQGEWIGFRSATITSTNATTAGALTFANGDITINGVAIPAFTTAAINTAAENTAATVAAINAKQSLTGVTAVAVDIVGLGNKDHIQLVNDNSGSVKNIEVTLAGAGTASGLTNANDDAPMQQFRFTADTTLSPVVTTGAGPYFFSTSEDFRQAMQSLAELTSPGATVTIDTAGKFQIANPKDSLAGGNSMNISVYAITDALAIANSTFDTTIKAISGTLPAGSTGTRSSQSFNLPTHSASIDIYDSLGSKHTVKVDFTKALFDPTTGSTWKLMISVPLPGEINPAGGGTGVPTNMIEGEIKFGPDGSLSTFTPPNINFTANNGSAPAQNVNLVLGTANAFDGLTSFDAKSATSGISQDGFTGGDLVGIRIDQSGTLVGSFSNGRSFGLAQIAMAKFANNGGLATQGGNLFAQSANSGDPIIGTAANGGRGFIQSSALEGSNVDLSRSLTELIVIQRGYQANSKTITTSDQLLQTLIGLKQ